MTKAELRYSVFIPPFHSLDEEPALCLQRDLELVEHLDRLGYDEAWFGEHHSGGFEIISSPELLIAAAAERTRTIRLGTGVISLPYHNPLMVAGRIAQLDHQTRGRAMFGFGPGLLASDAHMLGLSSEKQRDRMAEAVDVIVRLLDGEIVTSNNELFTLRDARVQLGPYRGRRPHLAVTSTVTPNGALVAGRHGLGMLCLAAASEQGYAVLDTNWEIACRTAEQSGRVMDRSNLRLLGTFHVAETRQQAIDDVAWGFEKWVGYAYQISVLGPAAIGLGSIETMIETKAAVIGTPDDMLAQLERYWQKTGGFGSIMIMDTNWASPEATKRSYDLIARHVMPKFAGLDGARRVSYHWLGDNVAAFTKERATATQQAIDKYAGKQSAS